MKKPHLKKIGKFLREEMKKLDNIPKDYSLLRIHTHDSTPPEHYGWALGKRRKIPFFNLEHFPNLHIGKRALHIKPDSYGSKEYAIKAFDENLSSLAEKLKSYIEKEIEGYTARII